MNILQAVDVTKQYANHKALNNVSVGVPEGSIFGLLGPNGAGKTTLIRIINQITGPDTGQVLLNGNPLKADDIYNIGYLPEERGLYKKMKVGEQAIYLARLKGLSRSDAIKRLKFWFEKFEIQPWWNKKVEELSKGMQQKIQFVVTILHEPKLLIFDEPFSGFDPINANLLKQEIITLRDKGASIIFSTHNMSSVEELCDDIALINKSEKILDGKVKVIRENFANNKYMYTYRGEMEKVNALLASGYRVEKHVLENDINYLQLKLENEEAGTAFLHKLIDEVKVISFNQVIPTMDDIFIKAVNEAVNN